MWFILAVCRDRFFANDMTLGQQVAKTLLSVIIAGLVVSVWLGSNIV
jgi:hypothetical protein